MHAGFGGARRSSALSQKETSFQAASTHKPAAIALERLTL